MYNECPQLDAKAIMLNLRALPPSSGSKMQVTSAFLNLAFVYFSIMSIIISEFT